MDEQFNEPMLFTNNFVFAKYWYTPFFVKATGNPISHLPGVEPGISGSIIGGNSLVINKYISDEKKQAALKALEFLTSKEMQKIVVTEFELYSGILDLYDDESICIDIDCEFFKSVQLIDRPTYLTDNYEKYSEDFRETIYSYLYGEAKLEDVLQQIIDLTKIYYVSFNTKETIAGVISIIIISGISLVIILSVSFIFMDNYKKYYQFLSNPLWIINLAGCVLILWATLIELGELTYIKCHLKVLCIILCLTLTITPVLYSLIDHYPKENRILNWIKGHPYLFIIMIAITDFILVGFTLVSPYSVDVKYVSEGKNFKTCNITNTFWNKFILIVIVMAKAFIFIALLVFSYLKRKDIEIKNDLKFLMITLYINVIGNISQIVVSSMDIHDYIIYFITREAFYIFFSVNNYVFFYVFRIIWAINDKFSNTEDSKLLKINKIVVNTTSDGNTYNTSVISTNSNV